MAEDWIKWVKGLTRKREVIAVANKLDVDRRVIAAACMEMWEWAEENTTDGHIRGVNAAFIDTLVNLTGFADALASREVGWLRITPEGVTIPNFDRHNGAPAKQRAQKNRRQARWRIRRDGDVDADVDVRVDANAPTREEKSRESTNPPLSPPEGGGRASEPPGFVRWWKAYPGKRTQKQRCLTIWRGKKPTKDGVKRNLEPIADRIIAALEAQKRAKHWRRQDGKDYIPNAPTWLYNANWEDEVDAPPDDEPAGLVEGGPCSLEEAEEIVREIIGGQ